MSTTATIAPAGTWQLDPVHSSVDFQIEYLAGTFKGTFREVSATLQVDDGRATLEGSATVESVDVKDPNLSAHLLSPEFFDAEQYPELRFRAEDVELDGETAAVRGDITIRGVTRPLAGTGTASAAIVDGFGRERLGIRLTATVDRTEFGLNWNMALPTGKKALADDVTIIADLQLVKAG